MRAKYGSSAVLEDGNSSRANFNVFSINDAGAADTGDGGSEASLNEEELRILAEMEKNDQELEAIAGQICGALDELKGNAENMEKLADDQGRLLDDASAKLDGAHAQLTQQNTELKQAI